MNDADANRQEADERERFRFRWADVPLVTTTPGTSGSIRVAPEDFRVDEIPLYLPEGSGSHAYALVRKRGLTTRDLVLALGRTGVEERAIGVAGLKDKNAVTSQWLSVPNRHAHALDALEELPGVEILERSRHRNKLGIGHLRGNRFTIRVRDAREGAAEAAARTLEELETGGVPNFFGPQRFGRFGANAIDGRKLLRGEPVPGGHRLKRFFVTALQSLLFNHLLAARVRAGLFRTVIDGDWAKKHDTGGVFLVEDAGVEAERARAFAISALLPLYGKKVRLGTNAAGELEERTLRAFGLRWVDFRSRHGDRRLSRIPLEDARAWAVSGDAADASDSRDYEASFTLPKGAFATIVLRELLKVDVDAPLEPGGEEGERDAGEPPDGAGA